jgi:hypothetical protein
MTELKTTPSGNAIIIERLNSLACDTAEIKNKLDKHEEAQNNFRIDYEVRHAEIEKKADAAHARMDVFEKDLNKEREARAALEKSVREVTDKIGPLLTQAKIVNWIAVILGTSIITLIWGILTHAITIVK